MSFHEYLRATRLAKGLSPAEVASRAGINIYTYYRMEVTSFKRLPPPDVIGRLAAALGVEPVELARASGYAFFDRRSIEPFFTREA